MPRKIKKDFGDPSQQTPRYYTPIPKPYTPIPAGGLTTPPPTKKPSVITRKATETAAKPTAPTPTTGLGKGQTYQIGGKQLTAREYETAKGILGFQGRGGLVTQNVKAALAGVPGTQQFAEAQAEQAIPELEEAGAFEEVTPEEVALTPEQQFGEELPILGPATGAIQSVLGNALRKGWLPILETRKGEEPFPITEETLREASLAEIRKESLKEGISLRESFGSLVEAIPVVGTLASKYAGGLIETPSSNAEDVIAEINRIKEAASTGQEKVRNNLEDPEYGLDRARNMEEDIAKLEGRLKALINTSARLRTSSDQINLIQEQILEAREKVSRYRNAATFGLTAQLTGTGRVVPTDEQLFFALKDYKE
jgi:hypothetical protein